MKMKTAYTKIITAAVMLTVAILAQAGVIVSEELTQHLISALSGMAALVLAMFTSKEEAAATARDTVKKVTRKAPLLVLAFAVWILPAMTGCETVKESAGAAKVLGKSVARIGLNVALYTATRDSRYESLYPVLQQSINAGLDALLDDVIPDADAVATVVRDSIDAHVDDPGIRALLSDSLSRAIRDYIQSIQAGQPAAGDPDLKLLTEVSANL